ncbi:MAG: transcription-repair coupling factor [Clostridiales bacterium]|nr:transcription-repair coupling factor [Clostridiales bacterium]
MKTGSLILDLIRKQEAYKSLLSCLDEARIISVSGAEESAATSIVSALKEDSGHRFIWVCENELLARKRAEDFCALGITSRALPHADVTFFHADAQSKEFCFQRLDTLGAYINGKIDVLVVPAEALRFKQISKARFIDNTTVLKTGDIIRPETLIEHLVKAGYERVDMVEGRGQCSLRGGIADLYPVNHANALRVEFFDDEIDSLREFDVLTQRSLTPIKSAEIYPAREILFSKQEAADAANAIDKTLTERTEAQNLLRQRELERQFGLEPCEKFFKLTESDEIADTIPPTDPQGTNAPENTLRAGHDKRFRGLADALRNSLSLELDYSFLAAVCGDCEQITDYFPSQIVVVEHADRVKERLRSLSEDFFLNYKTALERGEALPFQAEIINDFSETLQSILKHSIITLDIIIKGRTDFPPQKLIKFDAVSSVGFNGNIKEISTEIRRLQQNNAYIALLAGSESRGARLSRALADEGVIAPFIDTDGYELTPAIPAVLTTNLSSGFSIPELPLYVFCEDDLFGRKMQKKRSYTSSQNKTSAFIQLNVGDYVVHENHGIGQYLGTVRMTVDGRSRDFLNIRYGGTDKLYVPTDQMDRIQKYIGSEGEAPKLNRLSGGEWQKQKSRVQKAIREIAGDLIKLYAQRSSAPGYAFAPDTPWQREFEDAFQFEETPDQVVATDEIKRDMEKPRVMDRLLCGDVGYGKTEVALRAVFKCVMEGKQAVLLAPTTILVQQHYATALNRFGSFPVRIDTLSRFKTSSEQKEVIHKLKKGEIDFVIGTHRLLGKDIEFKDLGLLVVDEEQRFGVSHKETIKQYKQSVDVLTLSATPIPRTLHMSMVGIRDMSILKTPPEERFPIQTYVVEYSDSLVRDAILRELSRGGQVYMLYNRVQSIEIVYSRLKRLVPEARIAIAHGQMREHNLEDVMLDFYDGKFDVLLCSTIIEAGLDVPRANTLIVCDADRFGLSQLYQLRGRVGRSNRVAYAYLTVNPNKILTQDAEKRLNAIREFTEFGSGFRVAMRDLEIRGAGNILGAEQSGHMAAVGYDLYVKMIDEAIRELQGTVQHTQVSTKIDIAIDAYLPSDYVTSDVTRIEMYKRIAEISNKRIRDDVIDELIDRFGDPDRPVINLINIALLKTACEKLFIDNVSYRSDMLMLRFSHEGEINVFKLLDALKQDSRFKLLPKQKGVIAFSEVHQPVEKLIVSCAEGLNSLFEKMQQ